MTTLATRSSAPTVYLPPAARAALLAEALGCIITGRPLPEALRPPDTVTAAPATVQEGIDWLLAGPSATPRRR